MDLGRADTCTSVPDTPPSMRERPPSRRWTHQSSQLGCCFLCELLNKEAISPQPDPHRTEEESRPLCSLASPPATEAEDISETKIHVEQREASQQLQCWCWTLSRHKQL